MAATLRVTYGAPSDLVVRVSAIRDSLELPGHPDTADFADPDAVRASTYAADAVSEDVRRIQHDADALQAHADRIGKVLGAADRFLGSAAEGRGDH